MPLYYAKRGEVEVWIVAKNFGEAEAKFLAYEKEWTSQPEPPNEITVVCEDTALIL